MSDNDFGVLPLTMGLVGLQDALSLKKPVIVAGGAVRDFLNDRPVRDIDTYCSEQDFANIAWHLCPKPDKDTLFTQVQKAWETRNEEEYRHQSISVRLELQTTSRWPIDLIGLRDDSTVTSMITAEEVTSKFNIGFSQVAYVSGYPMIYSSEAYKKDNRDQTLTVLREEWGLPATQAAVEKVLKKYPAFRPVFADGSPWSPAAARERCAKSATGFTGDAL